MKYCTHLSERLVLARGPLWWYIEKALHSVAGCPSPQVRPAEQYLHVKIACDLVPLLDSGPTCSHAPADSGRAVAMGCIAAASAGCGARQRGCCTCGSALGVPAPEGWEGSSGRASSREKEELFLEGRTRARWNLHIWRRTY